MFNIELNREELSRRGFIETLQQKLNEQIDSRKSEVMASRLSEVLRCFCLPPAFMDDLLGVRENTKESLQNVKVRVTAQTLEDRQRIKTAREFIERGLSLFSEPEVKISKAQIDMVWPDFLDMNIEGTRPVYKSTEVKVGDVHEAPWFLRLALSMRGLPVRKVEIYNQERPYIVGVEGFKGWAHGSWESEKIHSGAYRIKEERTGITYYGNPKKLSLGENE